MYIVIFALIFIFFSPRSCAQNNESYSCDNEDSPLFLTPFLDNNQTEEARRLSAVNKEYLDDFVPNSHAGFITVDRQLGNHLFFWFFPKEKKAGTPLVVWLNGGPTISSMLGLWFGNGPMVIDTKYKRYRPRYTKRRYSWTKLFSVLYVDNPVNTGFSFSDSGHKGEKYTEEGITQDLYNFLEQFLVLFPEYKDREIYLGGQSYAGMYVISLAHFIHTEWTEGRSDLTIAGIYLGGPYFDPIPQILANGDFLYNLGVFSHKMLNEYKDRLLHFFSNESSIRSPNITLDDLLKTTMIKGSHWDNFITREKPPYFRIETLMNDFAVRKAVHAGKKLKFRVYNEQLRQKFVVDYLLSRREKLAALMDEYKVLIYNGDTDSIISTGMIEASLLETPWKLRQEYNSSRRTTWYTDTLDGDGYPRIKAHYTRVGQFCRVVVRGAGHQTPHDRPRTTLQMMTYFIRSGCIIE